MFTDIEDDVDDFGSSERLNEVRSFISARASEEKTGESQRLEVEVENTRKLNEVPFEEAFNLTGHGRFNHFAVLTCGLIMLYVSMETMGISYVIPVAECDLQLTSLHKGIVTAASLLGIISTSLLWGYLGDKYGRRAVMLPAMLASAVLTFVSSFSVNFWILATLRFLAGCMVSASAATVYAYLGELHSTAKRASAIAWGSTFISLSFIILPGLAWLIIPGKWSWVMFGITIVPWRVYIWSWCIPTLVSAYLLFLLPESPRYMLSSYGPDKAMPILARMYACNHKKNVEDFPVAKIIATEPPKTRGYTHLKNLAFLIRPPLLRCVLISHTLMFSVFMLSSGLYLWVPDIMNNVLISNSFHNMTICKIIYNKFEAARGLRDPNPKDLFCDAKISEAIFPITMSMGALFAVTFFGIGVLISRIGRRLLYSIIMVVCGAATILAAFVPHGGVSTGLLVIALCSGCAASILAAIAVDVYPTILRSMAMCTMYMMGRLGAAVGANILGATLNNYCDVAVPAVGAFTAGVTVLILFWPNPEKVQKEMEEKGLTY